MKLRPYQQEALTAVLSEWERVKSTLLVLPTGCGKTIVFAKIAENQVFEGKRVLILAHRGELLEQASDKIYQSCHLICATEKAEQSCLGKPNRIVVGSVQSLTNPKRLDKFNENYFDIIIIDEAHHAVSKSYQRVLQHFPNAKILGVTATPDRAEDASRKKEDYALRSVFDSCAYEYSIHQAIEDGYLCEIKTATIPLKIDLSKVHISAGDFKENEIADVLEPYLEQIADQIIERCENRKTVVFLPLIRTAQAFRDILNKRGFPAEEVNGESLNRGEILEKFESGKYKVLCNSMLLTEGWDCPSVDCVVVLRPTKVRALYSQMVGRGTRLCDGKENLLLLDFLWHSARHNLCHPADIFTNDPEKAQKMTEKILDSDEEQDLLEIEQEIEEDEKKKSASDERESSLAKMIEENADKQEKILDGLDYELSFEKVFDSYSLPTQEVYNDDMGWHEETISLPPTERQLETLRKNGFDPEKQGIDRNLAFQIISLIAERSKQGLASPKQLKQLKQKGFRHVERWTYQQASEMMGILADNHWRTPKHIAPQTYNPQKSKVS